MCTSCCYLDLGREALDRSMLGSARCVFRKADPLGERSKTAPVILFCPQLRPQFLLWGAAVQLLQVYIS